MTSYERCNKSVDKLADTILNKHESHKPVVDAKVTIDFVFAMPEYDEKTGKPLHDALTKNGVKALGIARKIALKDRALGRADAEIAIDRDWWEKAPEPEQEALLDHELHHIAVKIDKRGLVTDDLGRPVIQLRKHDYEFGFFKVIAARNGLASPECIYAKHMLNDGGQYLFPYLQLEIKSA